MLCIHFRLKLSKFPCQLCHTASRGIPINSVFLLCIYVQLSTWTSEANSSKTICRPHLNSLTLGPGLNVFMYATCNATHTALCLGLYLSAFLKLHADYPNRGRNVWSQIGSHQCCMHKQPSWCLTAQISSLEDASYCKGGASQLHPSIDCLTSIK